MEDILQESATTVERPVPAKASLIDSLVSSKARAQERSIIRGRCGKATRLGRGGSTSWHPVQVCEQKYLRTVGSPRVLSKSVIASVDASRGHIARTLRVLSSGVEGPVPFPTVYGL